MRFSKFNINLPKKDGEIQIADDLLIKLIYPKNPKTLMVLKITNLTSKWLSIVINTAPTNKLIDLGPEEISMDYNLFKDDFIIKYEEVKRPHWL